MPLMFSIALRRAALVALGGVLTPFLLAAQSTGSITGRVVDTQGGSLQGATVSLAGTPRGAIVRSDGSYRLTAPAGRYEIRARLLGYTPRSDSLTVTAGQEVIKTFTLERAATSIEAVSVIGTRGEERTVISAPVPIDVLSSLEVRSTGRTETSQMIQALAPSFNFPRTTLGDATDNVRPATLRGLSPDQALVLVNGKRRHVSAVVNINGFVGRGSEAVDLNAIPAGMIDHIEILRDGAAAQYGSDAIAGVINIVLKSSAPGDITAQAGEYTTKEPATLDYRHDGKLFYANADHGWSFGQNGYLFLGAELRDRGFTNRAAPDTRIQYFANDPRNSDPNLPIPGRIDFKIGDSYQHDELGWLNAGATLANGAQVYAFGGLSRRFGDAFGFWRRPRDDNNLRQIYPNGFLPEEQPVVWDGSGVVGLKGQAVGWDYDLSTGYGRDVFDMNVVNSVNVSLGPSSPTRFYAGQLAFGQWTTNLDVSRDFKTTFVPLHTAWGLEFRDDQYKVGAGDTASYVSGPFTIFDSTGAQTNRPAPSGSQVYPGFQPTDAGSHSRNNVAGYVDLSSDLTSQLLLDLAGRYEHYSDFGNTTTGKAAARYEPIHGIAFRGAVSSGFRAPSLGQEFFSNTAINFVGTPAVPLEIRTFPVSDPIAQVLHAKPLRPEKSMNYSAGVALEPLRSLSLTVDFYRIDLKDRIVLSNNFTSAAVVDTLKAHGITNVQGGRYFTNAVDSRTNGLDIIGNYGYSFTPRALLRLTAAYNGNWTKVTRIDSSAILPGQGNALFSRVDQARLEKGNPRNNLVLSANLGVGRFGIDFRNQRFGKVTSFGTTPAGDQTWDPKWVSDLALSYGPITRATVTLGADNIFNTYPDPTISGNTNSGILPYSGISPFGINGRFVYAKLSYGW
jgi:iron complex outermembrane receptor protein